MTSLDLDKCRRLVHDLWTTTTSSSSPPKNDILPNEPVWCLGREYSSIASTSSDTSQSQSQPQTEHDWPPSFLLDFTSRIWLTYRHSFPPIPRSRHPDAANVAAASLGVRLRSQLAQGWARINSSSESTETSTGGDGGKEEGGEGDGDGDGFTSDTGWGCMIRSGQMLLANALGVMVLGRDWRRKPNNPTPLQSQSEKGTQGDDNASSPRKEEEQGEPEDDRDDDAESRLLSLFADDPRAPFSIHRFVQHGASRCGKFPGEWFGPSATASCIQALCAQAREQDPEGKDIPHLNVYVSLDSPDVYEDKLFETARRPSSSADSSQTPPSTTFHPTLILLCIRLGLTHLHPLYHAPLTHLLRLRSTLGIAGGQPSRSLYFVGAQGEGEWVFYLDPHVTRQAVKYPGQGTGGGVSESEAESFHAGADRLRRMRVREVDPSMMVGFLVKDEEEYREWKEGVRGIRKGFVHVYEREGGEVQEGGSGVGSQELGQGQGQGQRQGVRAEAVDEVEVLSEEEEDEGDGFEYVEAGREN